MPHSAPPSEAANSPSEMSRQCPQCGTTSTREHVRESDGMAVAIYFCPGGHLFQVWWTGAVG